MSEPTSCCRALCTGGAYCHNCDLLVGLDGLHVTAVDRAPDLLTVTVESAPALTWGLSAKRCFWPDAPAQLAGKVM
ncbi:hypothetical protein [Ornithinimicrobium pekingense]|uniref:hypothetical protein n=1 Tax=Ornithinimicrobium pekingense TaxID=384677 RepID=UPI0012EB9BA0|nr:hypothetical protein [Ornithinimicrobium pekingense]